MKIFSRKILSNTLWLIYSKIFTLLFNLFITAKVINYYGSTDYGMYVFSTNVVSVLEILVTFVEVRIVKKKYVDYPTDEVVWNATIARVILSGISFLIGLVYVIFSAESMEIKVMVFILLINSILVNMRFGMETHFEYMLESKRMVIAANIASLLIMVLQLVAIMLQLKIVVLCLISTVNAIVSFVIIYFQYRKCWKVRLRTSLNKRLIGCLLVESIPLAIAAAAATIYTKCDSLMLKYFMNYENVAIYSVSLKLYSIAQIAIVPVRTSFFPKQMDLYSTDGTKYETMYIKISSCMTWLCILGIIVGNALLPSIFLVFFNVEYLGAIHSFRVLCVGLVVLYNTVLRTAHISIQGNTHVLMYVQLISVGLNVIMNCMLIPKWGINGAAISTSITLLFSTFFSNLFFKDTRKLFYWQLKAFNPIYIFKKT